MIKIKIYLPGLNINQKNLGLPVVLTCSFTYLGTYLAYAILRVCKRGFLNLTTCFRCTAPHSVLVPGSYHVGNMCHGPIHVQKVLPEDLALPPQDLSRVGIFPEQRGRPDSKGFAGPAEGGKRKLARLQRR